MAEEVEEDYMGDMTSIIQEITIIAIICSMMIIEIKADHNTIIKDNNKTI